jgi:hypothetical protein
MVAEYPTSKSVIKQYLADFYNVVNKPNLPSSHTRMLVQNIAHAIMLAMLTSQSHIMSYSTSIVSFKASQAESLI